MTDLNQASDEQRALIQRLRELLAKATLTPWVARDRYHRVVQGSPRHDQTYGDLVTTDTRSIAKQQGYGRDNVALIVEAVNALPTLLDLIEQLAAQTPAQTGWRDIASAPKDGTEVDLWGAREVSPGRVPDCAWLTLADGPDWYTRGDNGWESLGAINWKPTHWQPRPAPPSTEPVAQTGEYARGLADAADIAGRWDAPPRDSGERQAAREIEGAIRTRADAISALAKGEW